MGVAVVPLLRSPRRSSVFAATSSLTFEQIRARSFIRESAQIYRMSQHDAMRTIQVVEQFGIG